MPGSGPNIEAMLSGAGVNLTADQRRTLGQVSPEQQEKLAQLVKWGPSIRKWVIITAAAAFVISIASDLVKFIEELTK